MSDKKQSTEELFDEDKEQKFMLKYFADISCLLNTRIRRENEAFLFLLYLPTCQGQKSAITIVQIKTLLVHLGSAFKIVKSGDDLRKKILRDVKSRQKNIMG